MTLTQNEKRKQWLTRGPIQRAIDHAKLRAKLFSKAQNLDKDTILVVRLKLMKFTITRSQVLLTSHLQT